MYDIISIGDATLDTFLKLKDASVISNPEKTGSFLALSFGDKIAVVRFDQKVAGNALNNAVGSARLGMKTAFYSIVGDDETGQKILRRMKREGISLEYVQIDRGKDSNYSVVINCKGERTILVYHIKRTYILPKLQKSKWIYYTSVGEGYEKLQSQLVRYLKRDGVKLGFNPGTHQLNKGILGMKSILPLTTVFFVNKEEAMKLVGAQTNIKELLVRIRDYGPEIVVITDGPHGSYTYDGRGFYKMGVIPMKLIEATGAGDAFATGFIAALFHDRSMTEAMRWGSANSASVVTKIGPQDGLLKIGEMRAMLKKFAKYKPEKIDGDKSF
ncbi:MAG: carbohydrate kinase family protein [Patescibacteria group bacterium]